MSRRNAARVLKYRHIYISRSVIGPVLIYTSMQDMCNAVILDFSSGKILSFHPKQIKSLITGHILLCDIHLLVINMLLIKSFFKQFPCYISHMCISSSIFHYIFDFHLLPTITPLAPILLVTCHSGSSGPVWL